MTKADSAAFSKALAALAEIFGEALSESRIEGYFLALQDLSLDALTASMAQAAKACKFFPKPAELIELVQGSKDDQAELAWRRLLNALSLVGTYQTVDFQDAALHQTIQQLGGWAECWVIERMEPRDLSFKRQEFKQLYGVFQRTSPTALSVLLGRAALVNRATQGAWDRGEQYEEHVMLIGSTGEPQMSVPLALHSGSALVKA